MDFVYIARQCRQLIVGRESARIMVRRQKAINADSEEKFAVLLALIEKLVGNQRQ